MIDEVRIGEGPKALSEESLDQITGADGKKPAPPPPPPPPVGGLGGVAGESSDSKHKDWIEIL